MKPLNLVVYGFNPWSSMWKRTQTLISLLERRDDFGEILFVNPSVHLMDMVRQPQRLRSGAYREQLSYVVPRRVSPGIVAYTPLVPPLAYQGKPLAPLRRRLEMRTVGPFLDGGFVLYLNALVRYDNPVFWELFERARNRIFDWSDDFSTFAANEAERAIDREIGDRFITRSDLVVAVNESLADRAKALNPNSYCLRNATNFGHMNRADAAGTRPHEPIARLSGPIVGYMGYMNPTRIDTMLLLDMARAHPGWQFVFIGPQVTAEPLGSELPRLGNVHLLPPVPYTDLPGVLKCFDVCIIPNHINEHTAGNDPIKLFDYLASGRPVVATPTAGLEAFDDVVDIAADARGFAALIGKHLERGGDEAAKARRLQAARRNSWEARAERFGELIEAHVTGVGEDGA